MSKKAKTAGDKAPKVRQLVDCPKCSKPGNPIPLVLSMLMPGRRMMWYCGTCNHEQPKTKHDWKI